MSRRATLAAITLLSLLTGPAFAQSVREVGQFRDWSAYAATEDSGAVCFALSKPQDVSPMPDGYSEAYLYLTHRPSENVRNELNLVAGFMFEPDSTAVLTVSGQSFDLLTERDAAWLLDPSQADTLAGVMRAGSSLTVEGTSDKGIRITETFSLSGATAASRAIESGC